MEYIKAGQDQTNRILEGAFEFAKQYGVETVVVASTWGETGVKATRMGRNLGIGVVVVTHNAGFKEPGVIELTPENRTAILEAGGTVHTGTMVLRGLGSAMRKKFGVSDEERTAAVLRLFGQGMKVCVEMAAMVADAGLVGTEDIVCVAGTGRGADTAALIRPAPSNAFFDIKVRHIIAKPQDF
jgi:hypothetical protein